MNRFLSAVAMTFGWAVLLGGITAPVAGADNDPAAGNGKSLVVMGDSNTANATWTTPDASPESGECAHQPTSWPTQMGQRMGLRENDVADVSCVGSYLYRHGEDRYWTALTQTRRAAEIGAFGTRTKAVLLQFGLNDIWGENHKAQGELAPCLLNIERGCSTADVAANGTPPKILTGQDYVDHLGSIVAYLRYYAPNARIILVGYQELHTPGDTAICTDILGVPMRIPRASAVTDVFESVQQAPKAGAAQLGIEFFDARAATAGHGLCSDDPWLTGVFTPGRDFLGQPGHPTLEGDAAVSAALQQYLAAPAPQAPAR
ncbi:GDSL-type esterase/lipase family protein [Nocardia sp. NPDC057668]|uniref:GDSL-type esterase/lipase family protein n=1 Tax=Nocardia sp. NPDC057668 TaxID=3346202 RepID=UPI00366E75C1